MYAAVGPGLHIDGDGDVLVDGFKEWLLVVRH
jgi:hypothetical protein